MPRPKKMRRVCALPKFKKFGPLDKDIDENNCVLLTVEEFQVIRFIDLERLEQKQCAEKMGVARSTIQRMYNEAKCKVADGLVNGKILKIEGGDYILCDMNNIQCPSCLRKRHRHGRNNHL